MCTSRCSWSLAGRLAGLIYLSDKGEDSGADLKWFRQALFLNSDESPSEKMTTTNLVCSDGEKKKKKKKKSTRTNTNRRHSRKGKKNKEAKSTLT